LYPSVPMLAMRLLLPVVLLLVACGQTGPLVLPEQTPEPITAAPSQEDRDEQPRRAPSPTAAETPDLPADSPSTDTP
jgi:predicted small lipoprotein YifL